MAKRDTLVGIEIGTSKICVTVGEGREDGSVQILGIGETPSRGVRKGEIVDFNTAMHCVNDALADAEEKSGMAIETVWVAVTGSHIQSFNSRGGIRISPEREEIDETDLRDVEINAKEVNIPPENTFIHTMIQRYYIDGQEGVLNPVGMLGHRLEGDFHIIHGVTTRIQNTLRCIREAGVDIEDVVVNSLCSSQMLIDQNHKNLGSLVIDIGGGTTDYMLFHDGSVADSGVLAVGGDHVTNDISIGLRIPITKAEKLKREEGSVSFEDVLPSDMISLKSDTGFSGRDIQRQMLNTIIHARMRELFEQIRKKLDETLPLDLLGGGIILTGGSSKLDGLTGLAEEVFGVPVSLTKPQSVTGPTSAFESPEYSTPIGLLRYAHSIQSSAPEEGFLDGIGSRIGKLFRGLRV